jgi:acetyl-CoA carboxylase carboxyl transferase subunit beta
VKIEAIANWFSDQKKAKKAPRKYQKEKLDIPGDLWVKCYKCAEVLYNKDLQENLKVCTKCGYHFKLTCKERLKYSFDESTFKEINPNLVSVDFLHFFDTKPYSERIKAQMEKSKLNEAVITGEVEVAGHKAAAAIMDFSFMGGSMGSVVGEKIARLIEHAISKKLPVIIVSSSGGARMQEGIMSLMQMAKTSAALSKLDKARLPYISILTDPTTGGTTASFAMLGDFHLAEPGALIGFAGPRVIEQTIRQKLPPGFQRAEFLEAHGFIDEVVERKELKRVIARILEFCGF